MLKKILIPLPANDFDPSEAAIPWQILTREKVSVVFATPHGDKAKCDQIMLLGKGLGILSHILSAHKSAREAYDQMKNSVEFQNPIAWNSINFENFDGLILPGGHAKGMREYLESETLQQCVSQFFLAQKPVGAICHGVVLAARSKNSEGQSVLFGRKTTSLLKSQEMTAWLLTCLWMGDYYRTYKQTVQEEVEGCLKSKSDFISGAIPFMRDDLQNLKRGFVVRDKNYLSARWPGDAHLFATTFLQMI